MENIPDNLYRQIHEKMPIVCVDTVVCHENKIFLVKRATCPAKGEWWFPGGRLLRNEDLVSASLRITKSETGLIVRSPVFLGHGETIFKADPFNHGMGTHTVNFVFCAFAAALNVMSVTLDENHTAYSVFSPEEVYRSDMHPYVKRFVALSEGVVRK